MLDEWRLEACTRFVLQDALKIKRQGGGDEA